MRRLFLVLVAPLAILLGFATRLVRRYEVEGRSMLRAYAPGDRLLVESLSYRLRPPRVGEVVVLRQPGSQGRLDLKRIVAGANAKVTVRGHEVMLGDDEWYVLGDNLTESTDSRELGPVSQRDIVGLVWFKY